MLHGQRKRADTGSDRTGGHILRKNSLTVNCLGKHLFETPQTEVAQRLLMLFHTFLWLPADRPTGPVKELE